MKYCKYCGKPLAEGELCDCEAARAERNENVTSSTNTQNQTEAFESNPSNEQASSSENINHTTNTEKVSSNDDEQVTINIDVGSFKTAVNNGLNAFKNPYSYGSKYIKSLNYKNSILIMVISALVTALFALIVCTKLNSSVNRGLIGLGGLIGESVPAYSYNAISTGKAFFLSILYSLIVSLLLACSYFLSYKIFKVRTNFEDSMALAALRATYTIPVKLVAAVLALLALPLGVLVFFMSSLLISSLISASIFSEKNVSNDKAARASMLIRFLFVIIFFAVARRGAPNFLNSELINGIKNSLNVFDSYPYGSSF